MPRKTEPLILSGYALASSKKIPCPVTSPVFQLICMSVLFDQYEEKKKVK